MEELSISDKRNIATQKAITALSRLLDTDYITSDDVLQRSFREIIARLQEKTFRIAVVGEFSSGKSTFLNALLGRDILTHGREETTATVTEIMHDNTKERLEIYYSDGHKTEVDGFDDIEQFTSKTSSNHQVAQDIDRVVLHGKILPDLQNQVVFIDTPGLNGLAKNHLEKTIALVRNAHACIYLFQVRGVTEKDKEYIQFLCQYQHDFIFVQNFIDELKSKEGDTPENKLAKDKEILQNYILKDLDVNYRVCAVSSSQALKAQTVCSIAEKRNESMYMESRFIDVIKVLNELLIDNMKNALQQKAAIGVAIKLLKIKLDSLDDKKIRLKQDWEDSISGRIKADYDKTLMRLETQRQKKLQIVDDFISHGADDIRKVSDELVERRLCEVKQTLEISIDSYQNMEDLEKYAGKDFKDDVNNMMTVLGQDLRRYMDEAFEGLLDNAIIEMRKYVNGITGELKVVDFSQEKLSIEKPDFQINSQELSRLQSEKIEAEERASKHQEQVISCTNDTNRLRSHLGSLKSDLEVNEVARDRVISNMGSEPSPQKRSRTKTEYREKSGPISWLKRNLGFGDRGREAFKVTEYYYDYSNVEEWKRNISEKRECYNLSIRNLEAKIRSEQRQLNDAQEQIKHSKDKMIEEQERVTRLIKYIENKKKQNQEAIKTARQEYLRSVRKELKQVLSEYLAKVQDSLSDTVEQVKQCHRETIQKLAQEYYNTVMDQRIKEIRRASQGQVAKDLPLLDQAKDEVFTVLTDMEDVLCQM